MKENHNQNSPAMQRAERVLHRHGCTTETVNPRFKGKIDAIIRDIKQVNAEANNADSE